MASYKRLNSAAAGARFPVNSEPVAENRRSHGSSFIWGLSGAVAGVAAALIFVAMPTGSRDAAELGEQIVSLETSEATTVSADSGKTPVRAEMVVAGQNTYVPVLASSRLFPPRRTSLCQGVRVFPGSCAVGSPFASDSTAGTTLRGDALLQRNGNPLVMPVSYVPLQQR